MEDTLAILGVTGIVGLVLWLLKNESLPGNFSIPKFPGQTQAGGGSNIGREIEDVIADLNNLNNSAGKVENGIDVNNLPRDRVLTLAEVYALANAIRDRFFPNDLNPIMLTAMASIESSFKPYAIRKESGGRQSTGLMQTLLGTALDLYSKGYNSVGKPTHDNLKDPYISMYFGASYVHWLFNGFPNHFKLGSEDFEEWYVRAYNGGPGWERSNTGRTMTANHYAKYKAAKADISNKLSITI